MKDDSWVRRREDLAQARLVADIARREFEPPPEVRVEPLQLQPLVVQLGFVVVEQDHPLRPEGADLVDDLRADRPARAGHQNRLPPDERADPPVVNLHRLPSHKVFDADILEFPKVYVRLAEVVNPRDDLDHLHLRLRRPVIDGSERLVVQGRNGDNHRLNRVSGHHRRQLVGSPQHPHPVDVGPLFVRIVVEKADRVEIIVAVAHHVAQHHLAGVSRADDQGLLPPAERPLLADHLQIEPFGNPQARDQPERNDPIDKENPLRKPPDREIREDAKSSRRQASPRKCSADR